MRPPERTRRPEREPPPDAPPPTGPRRSILRRLLPLFVLVALIAAVYLGGLHRYLGFDTLREHRQALLAFVAARPLLAPLLYVVVYAATIALSVPGGTVLTVTGGFLFGLVQGSALTVIGATIGATLVFLIARTALGDSLRARAGPWLARMQEGFRENALSYLLVLRLVPLFPFWLVNLVPAFLGVPLGTYVLATLLGIIPGSVVYTSVGNGLGAVLDAGGTPDLGLIFRPEILLPILGLAALALVPALYRRLKAKG
jgi:uncharacterized membrane protein YdjX (TVP38/TMEM64 family)